MLTFKLIYETESVAEYEYHPEGNQKAKGLVSVSKKDGSISVVDLSPADEARIYAMKLFKRLRQFFTNKEYEKQGSISWY